MHSSGNLVSVGLRERERDLEPKFFRTILQWNFTFFKHIPRHGKKLWINLDIKFFATFELLRGCTNYDLISFNFDLSLCVTSRNFENLSFFITLICFLFLSSIFSQSEKWKYPRMFMLAKKSFWRMRESLCSHKAKILHVFLSSIKSLLLK